MTSIFARTGNLILYERDVLKSIKKVLLLLSFFFVAVIINVINIIIFIFMIAILILQLHQNISIFKLVYFVPFRFIRKIMGRGWGIGIAYIRGGWAESFFALCVDLFSRCMTGRQGDISVGGVDNKPKCLIETVLISLSLSSFF